MKELRGVEGWKARRGVVMGESEDVWGTEVGGWGFGFGRKVEGILEGIWVVLV